MGTTTFKLDGQNATEEQAINAWVAYETANSGTSARECIRIFDRALEDSEDGAEARDEIVAAGVEIFVGG